MAVQSIALSLIGSLVRVLLRGNDHPVLWDWLGENAKMPARVYPEREWGELKSVGIPGPEFRRVFLPSLFC